MIPPTTFGATSSTYSAPPPQPGMYAGVRNYGVQQYLPLMDQHALEKPDNKAVQKNLHNWWPKIGAGYRTPAPELLASEWKSGILGGAGAALMGAVGGAAIKASHRGRFALIGAALATPFGAVTSFINRRQQNDNIIGVMEHSGPNVTKLDILSNPVYQKDRELAAMRSSGNGAGDLFTSMMMASVMSNGFNSRRR